MLTAAGKIRDRVAGLPEPLASARASAAKVAAKSPLLLPGWHHRLAITAPVRALAIIAVALLAAACGSSPSSPGTSSSSSNSPAAAAFKFASCMRDHGVANFPDPQVTTTPGGGSVGVRQAVPASTGLSPKFKAAQNACKAILPPPGSSGHGHQGPSKQVFLAFARCLRSHGMSDFPDPNAQGQLTLQMISAAGVDLKAPSFLTAAKACVGVTHGQITLGLVAQAINGPH
jgi:hypothetical protein